MGANVSYPNLLTVLKWSAVGSLFVVTLASDSQQEFAFAAVLGYLSNSAGYEYANFDPPSWALPLGSLLTGMAAVYPVPTILSLIMASLLVPTYLTFEEIKNESDN